MAFSVRRLGRRFFVTVNVVCCLFLMASLLLPYLNPDTFWFVGFLGIAMPYLVLLVAAFVFFWMVLHWQYMFISLICLGIAYSAIGNLFSYNSTAFSLQKEPDALRVMTWNVGRFAGSEPRAFGAVVGRYNPDILCMQEFGVLDKPEKKFDDRIAELERMGYPFYVLSRDYSRKRYGYSNGLAIFSKYPFAATKRTPFTSSPESILRADVVVKGDTFHVYTTHLQSYKFDGSNYREMDRIQGGKDSLLQSSRNIISKMKRAFRNRGSQSRQLEAQLDSTRYPALICTDLNDVPNSYAYGRLLRNRTDAFNGKGNGIGRTYKYLLPTLRIDYVFADPQFAVLQYHQVANGLSDHYAVVADVMAAKAPADTILPNLPSFKKQ